MGRRDDEVRYIYMLHFTAPFNAEGHRHYVGMCMDYRARIAQHRAGEGGKFTGNLMRQGYSFEVVKIWRVPPGVDLRAKEKRVKQMTKWLCPYCTPALNGKAA